MAHEKRRGPLAFVRMYKGMLNASKPVGINNISRGAHLSDGHLKLFVPFSDELEPVDHIDAGNIAVVSGLNNTVTGDTILDAR
jgi:elongation factor G